MKNLFETVNELALKEIEMYGGPSLPHYHLALQKGEELAKKLGANVEVVKLGCALMDIKLGWCIKEGIQKEHVQKSFEYAKEILNGVDDETKNVLLDCVKSHHGTSGGDLPVWKRKSVPMLTAIGSSIRKGFSPSFKL